MIGLYALAFSVIVQVFLIAIIVAGAQESWQVWRITGRGDEFLVFAVRSAAAFGLAISVAHGLRMLVG